jgi:glycosyltransferase involved in cell wall biosynthesis
MFHHFHAYFQLREKSIKINRMDKAKINISIVVPLFNEQENVRLLHDSIVTVMDELDERYEILMVNDGSADGTLAAASAIASQDLNVKIVDLRRNYGQTAAMAAGIKLAKGELIVTLDGDLQNDPADIPMMIEKAREGFDIVVGWRHQRHDNVILRTVPSVVANRLIGMVTGVPVRDNGCTLKVYRAEIIQRLPLYGDMHRFLPALLSMAGSRISEVKVCHHPRQFGGSKYGLSRIYKVLFDLITIRTLLSLVTHPIRWFAALSGFPFTLSALLIALFLFDHTGTFDNTVIAGLAVLFLSLSGFLLGLGLIAESVRARGNWKLLDLAEVTAVTSRPNGVE